MRYDMSSKIVRFLVSLSMLFTSLALSAEDASWQTDKKFVVWAQVFNSTGGTEIRVDSTTLGISGTLLDMQQDLGLDETVTLPIVGVQWRISKKHVLDLAYFELRRNGQYIIEKDIRWDEFVFPISLDVRSNFDTKTTRLAYRCSLISDATKEFSIGGGLHWTDIEAGISETTIGSSTVESAAPLLRCPCSP